MPHAPFADLDWEQITGPAQKTFDKHSRQVLAKYSALAAQAHINYEAVEVQGHHAVDAISAKCAEVNADLLIKPAPSARLTLQRALRGSGGDMCRHCNPYLRSTGRIKPMRPIGHREGSVELPCPLLTVTPGKADQLREYGQIGGGVESNGYAVLSPAATAAA